MVEELSSRSSVKTRIYPTNTTWAVVVISIVLRLLAPASLNAEPVVTKTAAPPSATIDPSFVRFAPGSESLVKSLATKHSLKVRPLVWDFFQATEAGDWITSKDLFAQIEAGSGRRGGTAWLPQELWVAAR